MSELAELIRINKNIENQNKEIIRLLKIIAGQSDFVDRSGYVFPEFPEESKEIIEKSSNYTSLLENEIDVGEVYFIDDDIYRMTGQINEIVIDNLMGDAESTNFKIAEIVLNETIQRNQSLDDCSVILTESSKGKLPQTLQLCYEQGAKNVYVPWQQMVELIGAPDTLQRVLNLSFYRTEEELIRRIFE